jgi:hypothetical protein
LKDVDIFFVLKPSDSRYRSEVLSVVLTDFHKALADKYGEKAKTQNRSINVDFWREGGRRRQYRLPRRQRRRGTVLRQG